MPQTVDVPGFFVKGEVITADNLNRLVRAVRRVPLQPGQYVSGTLLLQAEQPRRQLVEDVEAKVVDTISPATSTALADMGEGTVQIPNEDGTPGTTFTVKNRLPATFSADTMVWIDRNQRPPRVKTGSCNVLPDPTETDRCRPR